MKYINISDLMDSGWRFLEEESDDPRLRWEIHSGRPRNRLESIVRKPSLSRYRAILEAVRSLRRSPDGVLVSHLPSTTLPSNILRNRLAPAKAHIAFAFNFTTLPTGKRLELFKRTLPTVDELVVFSRFEIDLYSRYFDIPTDKLRFLPWAMHAPAYDGEAALPFEEPYLCALGGEGRDYRTLVAAMRGLPDLKLALIARPHNLSGLDIPDNVRVYTNIPSKTAWAIAKNATGLAVPLLTDETMNGHVTMVGAQLLGIPLAVTRSVGVSDYVDDTTAYMMPVGNVEAMRDSLTDLNSKPAESARKAATAQAAAQANNGLGNWVDYFRQLEDRLSAG